MSNKQYEQLTFADDFMFCKILSTNEDLCKELLELILQIKIRKIVVLNQQKTIRITADAKSIRLDVYVEDDANTIYNVEIQTSKLRNIPKRSRYYQGMMDLNIIESGADYKTLKKSYVIFICLTDPFGCGRHIYTFENRCIQDLDLPLGDETVKVFINAAGTADDVSPELADFLHFLRFGVGESEFSKRLKREVDKARSHKEWRTEYMTLQMKINEAREEGWEEGIKEGIKKGIEEGIEKGMKAGMMKEKTTLVFKKLKKGQSIEAIAEAMEETVDVILQLIHENGLNAEDK